MRTKLRLVGMGVGAGAGCTALAALVALLPSGWDHRRFGLYMMALSILTLTIGLASLVSAGALGRWAQRREPPEETEKKEETAWLVVSAAATIFLLWLLLGPGQV